MRPVHRRDTRVLPVHVLYLGITAGTSATTFSPDDPLTRGQAAVFVAKGLNQSLARSSRRAAIGQWWTTTPHYDLGLGVTNLSLAIRHVASDGTDIWVAGGSVVYRVRASDGELLETWTGATSAHRILIAMGRVFVVGSTSVASPNVTPGVLYMIDPSQPAGPVTTVATDLGNNDIDIAFDGGRIWVTDSGSSVAIVTPSSSIPWPVTKVSAGFSLPIGIVFDGANIWVADVLAGDLLKLDANGAILQAVHTGASQFIAFDGANIWVPGPAAVTIVQASTGAIVATLTGNGLQGGNAAAFDGQRVMVTSPNADTVSLWNAEDLSALGWFSTGAGSLPYHVCSDGINFWLTLGGPGQLARF